MPRISIVFSMVVSSFNWIVTGAFFRFLSRPASRRRKRLSRSALDTTQKLERLMAAAPSMGFSVSPSGINTPAAMGMPTVL